MNFFSRFFLDLGLFLVFFGIAGGFLYTGVYSNIINYTSQILISEIRPAGGTGKANDEFVEIYNPKTDPVVIGGYMIYRQTKTASSTDRQLLFTFPAGTILPGHTHVLVAHQDYQGGVLSDFQYTGQALSDDNTVILINNQNEIVDLVGYGAAKNFETAVAEAPTTQLLSIERRAGGALGNTQDTNNNQIDFFRTQSNPQNLQSGSVPTLVYTSTTTSTEVSTSTSEIDPTEDDSEEVFVSGPEVETVAVSSTEEHMAIATTTNEVVEVLVISTPEIVLSTTTNVVLIPTTTISTTTTSYNPGSVLISELYPMPESGQNEFVELFNFTDQSIDLTGWFLLDGSGAKTILSGLLGAKNYLVIEKPKGSLNNSGDLVSLFSPAQSLIDKVAYGDWDDGNVSDNATVVEVGKSLGRVGMLDTNQDEQDFVLSATISKGVSNAQVFVNESEEVEEVPIITQTVSTNSASISKSTPKNTPLYPRIVYQAKGMVGEELIFDASQSTGGQGKREYIWEMDDGVILRGEIIKHQFSEGGKYSVVMTLTDDSGVEKHKTVKVVVAEKEVVGENEGKNPSIKIATTKKSEAKVFVALTEISGQKTNTPIRIRGILGGVIVSKTNPEFYIVGEDNTGGAATGVLIKTKSTNLDAKIGDLIEITGKYIVNNTGNYVQFADTDQLSLVESGKNIVPVSSTIKDVKQLTGGYVQILGEVVDKKSAYIFVADNTGEIKVNNLLTDSLKLNDRVTIVGYLIRTKEGTEIKLAGPDGVQAGEKVISSTEIQNNPPAKPIKTLVMVGLLVIGTLVVIIKKFWFDKIKIDAATEI